jgi:DNA-binding XRE family transcriptional regulator
MNKYLIYGLKDPRTDEYRYVGKTSNGLSRAKSHLNHSHNPLVNDWVNELMANDYKPDVVILENVVNQFELVDKEKYWVGKLLKEGYDLYNILIRKSYDTNVDEYNKKLQKQIKEKSDILEEKNKLLENKLANVLMLLNGSNNNEIVSLIKKRRKILNITQEELSNISSIGLRTIKNIESGKNNHTLSTFKKILDCLGFELFISLKNKV